MTVQSFVSNAQNREDVVLWRALHDHTPGRYVEVGANYPTTHSISRAFYDRGWSGIAIEPVPELARSFAAARPRDVVVQAAITSADTDEVVLHVVPDSGLSTLREDISSAHAGSGWKVAEVAVPARRLDDVLAEHLTPADPIHFLVVDTEGAEKQVLESLDTSRWRPWVLVVEATAPMSDTRTHEDWEHLVLGAGYHFTLFDGLSRWYVADEHKDLAPALDHPACVLDYYVDRRVHDAETRTAELESEAGRLQEQVVRARGQVLTHWASAAAAAVDLPGAGGVPSQEAARLRLELEQLQQTVSWRVTAPLRAARSAQLRRSTRS